MTDNACADPWYAIVRNNSSMAFIMAAAGCRPDRSRIENTDSIDAQDPIAVSFSESSDVVD
jgi:hypothetical protein